MRSAKIVTALVIGAVAVVAACTDIDRLPTAGSLGAEQPARLLGIQLATPAERASPLSAPVTWTFTVGPDGGVSRNDESGLTIVIPAGAVAHEQTITVTALPGASLAYRFEPHMTFAADVQLVQDLAQVRGLALQFGGAHFEGDVPQFRNGKVTVNEISGAVTSLLNRTVTISVGHFSGWIVTTGNENPDSSGTS
jgi:hypothetical protein